VEADEDPFATNAELSILTIYLEDKEQFEKAKGKFKWDFEVVEGRMLHYSDRPDYWEGYY